MPNSFDYPQTLPPEAATAPLFVQLPAAWTDFFQHRGLLPQAFVDQRRYPRYYYRGQALIEIAGRFRRILTKDLSRSGIGFYLHEQLFPLQELRVWLPGEAPSNIRVTRCVRINDQCYEIGAGFILEEDRAVALRQIARLLKVGEK